MGFEPSEYQKKIFSFITEGSGSAIVEAVAGSGKTTTIVQALSLIKEPERQEISFLAFNKKIKDELATRVPPYVEVMTLNGLGHRTWGRFFGKVRLNTEKTHSIVREMCKEDEELYDEVKNIRGSLYKLVSTCKSQGLVPENKFEDAHGILEDTKENWNWMINHFDIEFETDYEKKLCIDLTKQILKRSILTGEEIDFDDQLFMTVIYGAPFRQYDYIFVDEAQDISNIQRAMIERALKPEGRLIAVGDPCQAIYGFRGADAKSLQNIGDTFKCTKLPLSISYRCPQRVVAKAQEFVKHIEASPTAPIGTVQEIGYYRKALFQPKDMIVCRCVAPILDLAYKLIRKRKTVHVEGRDIGKGLITLINSLNAENIEDLCEKLTDWRSTKVKKMRYKNPDIDVSRIYDKYDSIHVFISNSKDESVDSLIDSINDLFGRTKRRDSIVLSTIHKAKGLEADRVFILDFWLMPIKYATQDWQIEQEVNLQYVAITRSKSELYFINSKLGYDEMFDETQAYV